MKKIIRGLSYLSWFMCNLAFVYVLYIGVEKMTHLTNISRLVILIPITLAILVLVMMLSIVILGLIAIMFNDEAIENLVTEWLPFLKND